MNANTISIGDLVWFKFSYSDGSVVTCKATVAKLTDTTASLRFSKRVLALPFPPCKPGMLLVVPREKAAAAKVV